jgi:hypothetical protein
MKSSTHPTTLFLISFKLSLTHSLTLSALFISSPLHPSSSSPPPSVTSAQIYSTFLFYAPPPQCYATLTIHSTSTSFSFFLNAVPPSSAFASLTLHHSKKILNLSSCRDATSNLFLE